MRNTYALLLITASFIWVGCADSDVIDASAAAESTELESDALSESDADELNVSGGKVEEVGGETSGYTQEGGYAGVQSCISNGCGDEAQACADDDDCAPVYVCVLECESDADCVDDCIELDVDALGTPLGALATCIAQEGCFDLDSSGGSSGEEGSGEEGSGEEGSGEEGSGEEGSGEEGNSGEEGSGEEGSGEEGGFGEGGFGEGGEIEEAITCVFTECADEVGACFTDPQCSKVIECLTTCGTDTGCLQNCGVSLDFSLLQGATGDLLTCGFNKGCIDLGGFGGGGEGGFGEGGFGGGEEEGGEDEGGEEEGGEGGDDFGCGDGVCEWWEEFYCEEDCGGGEGGEEEGGEGEGFCGDGFCDENAGEPFFCSEDCDGGGPGGGQGGGGFCGDGICEDFEKPFCEEDCGEPEGGEGSEGNDPFCGDGVCEVWEEAFCDIDCGEANEGGSEGDPDDDGETYECILESCSLGMCLNFPDCSAALECMGKCDNATCGVECLEFGPQQGPGAQILQQTVECANANCW